MYKLHGLCTDKDQDLLFLDASSKEPQMTRYFGNNFANAEDDMAE
jgi:hypothetical protein